MIDVNHLPVFPHHIHKPLCPSSSPNISSISPLSLSSMHPAWAVLLIYSFLILSMLVTQRKRQHLQLCSLSFLAPPPHNRTTWLPSPSSKLSLSYPSIPNQSRHSSPPILPCLQSLPRLSITGHYFHSGRLPFRPAILSLEDAPLESFPVEEVKIRM